MTRFLPVLISLLVIGYWLLVPASFAQTPTPTSGNAWENFINALIPKTLSEVNCSNLPYEACTGIKPTPNTTANTTLSTQATGNNTGNQEIVGNAAGQYVVASGIHTPPEVANASTNIILDFFANIAKFIGSIFDTGEKQAKNYAGTVLPQDVAKQNFAQGTENITGLATGNNTNVLGTQIGQSAMDKALPVVQCGALPAGLCTNNRPNFAQ